MTSGRYTYRQLTSTDGALRKGLLRVFAEAFAEGDTYQRGVPSDEYLTRLLNKEHFIAVVALQGKKVVGGLAAYELDKFEQERRGRSTYAPSGPAGDAGAGCGRWERGAPGRDGPKPTRK